MRNLQKISNYYSQQYQQHLEDSFLKDQLNQVMNNIKQLEFQQSLKNGSHKPSLTSE